MSTADLWLFLVFCLWANKRSDECTWNETLGISRCIAVEHYFEARGSTPTPTAAAAVVAHMHRIPLIPHLLFDISKFRINCCRDSSTYCWHSAAKTARPTTTIHFIASIVLLACVAWCVSAGWRRSDSGGPDAREILFDVYFLTEGFPYN